MNKDEALRMALEAAYLAGFNASGEGYNGEYPFDEVVHTPVENRVWKKDRDNYIKEALAQPEQEPVIRWKCKGCGHEYMEAGVDCDCMTNKGYERIEYFTSPQRKPLTFEQVEDCFPEGPSVFEDAYGDNHTSPRWLHAFARAIEAAHGIKE